MRGQWTRFSQARKSFKFLGKRFAIIERVFSQSMDRPVFWPDSANGLAKSGLGRLNLSRTQTHHPIFEDALTQATLEIHKMYRMLDPGIDHSHDGIHRA